MLKKIFMLGALLGAATLASGQVSRVQEGKSVQRQDAEFVSEYITPTRIMLAEGGVTGTENLLRPYCGQVSTNEPNVCIFRNGKDGRSSVLLDFGKEIQGGIQIVRAMSGDKAAARFRVCFGESVSEALSSVTRLAPPPPTSIRSETSRFQSLGSGPLNMATPASALCVWTCSVRTRRHCW